MATVEAILEHKGRAVISLAAGEPVLEAARLMNEKGIGSVVVTDEGDVVGIFTERDMVRRVVADQRDPFTAKLRDVMSSPVVSCSPDTPLNDCAVILTEKGIRRLPVSDDGRLVGLVTSRDILAYEVANHTATIEDLVDYIFELG